MSMRRHQGMSVGRRPGRGTWSSRIRVTVSAPTPSASAAYERISRWRSTARGDGHEILVVGKRATAEHRPRAAGDDERLGRTGSGPPLHVLTDASAARSARTGDSPARAPRRTA